MHIEQPEQWQTPEWVNNFIDFLTSKDLQEWQEKQNHIASKKLQVGKTNYFVNL